MDDFLSSDYMPFKSAKWSWWNIFEKNMRSEYIDGDIYFYMLTDFIPYLSHWVGFNDMTKRHEPLPNRDRRIDQNDPYGFNPPVGPDPSTTQVFPVPCIKNHDKCHICEFAANNGIENHDKYNYFALAKKLPSFQSVIIDLSPTRFENICRSHLKDRQDPVYLSCEVKNLFLMCGLKYQSDFNTNPSFRARPQPRTSQGSLIAGLNQVTGRRSRQLRQNQQSNTMKSPTSLFTNEVDAKHVEFIWDFKENTNWVKQSVGYALGETSTEADSIIEKLKSISLPDELDFEDIFLTRHENIMCYQQMVETFGRIRRRDDPEPTTFDRFKALEI